MLPEERRGFYAQAAKEVSDGPATLVHYQG